MMDREEKEFGEEALMVSLIQKATQFNILSCCINIFQNQLITNKYIYVLLSKLFNCPPKTKTETHQKMNFSGCWNFALGAKLVSESFNSSNQTKGWGKGRHLSSYTEDSICYLRPLLPSDTGGDTRRQHERVLFYRFIVQRFQIREKQQQEREKSSKCDQEVSIPPSYWREPPWRVKVPIRPGSVRSASIINAAKGAVTSHQSQRSPL